MGKIYKISLKEAWLKELDDIARALSGAMLFGVPMLYTFELWWVGAYIETWKLLLFLGVALVVNIPLAYFSGFKGESSFRNSLDQVVSAVAVGVVAALVILVVLNLINRNTTFHLAAARVVTEAVPLSIGASVANALVKRSSGSRQGDNSQPDINYWRATLNDIGATVAGGIFIGFSIAPTSEVLLLAARLTYWHKLGLIALSLLVTYIIVFESGFSPQRGDENVQGFLQRPITETLLAYVISLGVAWLSLFFFGHIGSDTPLVLMITQVLVLGLPTSIGGAAGRLVI